MNAVEDVVVAAEGAGVAGGGGVGVVVDVGVAVGAVVGVAGGVVVDDGVAVGVVVGVAGCVVVGVLFSEKLCCDWGSGGEKKKNKIGFLIQSPVR